MPPAPAARARSSSTATARWADNGSFAVPFALQNCPDTPVSGQFLFQMKSKFDIQSAT
jgi:hypothetical protein